MKRENLKVGFAVAKTPVDRKEHVSYNGEQSLKRRKIFSKKNLTAYLIKRKPLERFLPSLKCLEG
jgi:hypothetical protein